MKILRIVCVSLALGGCSWLSSDQVTQIRSYSVQICNFLPSIESVIAIVNAPNPAVTGAFAIAKAICQAVTGGSETSEGEAGVLFIQDKPKEEEKPREDCPKVNDVCVEGTFVDGEKK